MAHDFDLAVEFIATYHADAQDDSKLPQILLTVRELFPTAFERVLLWANVAKDPRYTTFHLANPVPIIREFQTTSDLSADTQDILEVMQEIHEAAENLAAAEAYEEENPYRRAAVRLLTKFREPNIEQMLYELKHL